MPVHRDSRKWLLVRHPGTGRLLWSLRLPSGYVNSPKVFCGVMEATADLLRRRAAGKGIHFFVFVDDRLVIGDTEVLTLEGCALLEDELRRRGITWAPHKHRGPAMAMEFLGLLLSNLKGEMAISLTRARRQKLLDLICEWESRREDSDNQRFSAQELASLLGKLVFASQVVLNGRTFMQAMLSSFVGCVVDWKRCEVSFRGAQKHWAVEITEGFWRDLCRWRLHLKERYSIRWKEDVRAEAAILGTDASGWGAGQLAWLDGAREETQLRFLRAEQRRPINWRELLGILRAIEHFGARLSGRKV